MTINKISGNILQDNLQRGANLAIQGNLFFVDVVNTRIGVNTNTTTATLTVNGNATISTTLDVTGNVIGGNLVTVGNVTATGNVIGGNITTGGLITASGLITATGNITSSANISAANLITTGIVFSIGNITSAANVQGGNLRTAGSISATGNITGGNLITGGILSVTGNATADYYFGNGSQLTGIDATSIQNGNSNVRVAANGNVSVGITGTSNVVIIASTGEYVTGVVSASGNITGNGVTLSANAISAASGIIDLGSNANIKITGGTANYVLTTDGSGNVSWTAADAGILGNNISMGTNTLGNLVSNAVTLTTGTSVTDGITQLNTVLGKLVPASPTNFPGSPGTLAIASVSSYRMANITQTDNTPGANKNVAAGTTVSTVRRAATYTTNTFTNLGPGDTGTITAVRNGANVGTVTLNTGASPSGNGTYGGNLVITNNYDYNVANANIAAGFWYVFTSTISGTASPTGWNEIYIADSATSNTSTAVWYYDNSSPSTPSFSSTTMAVGGSTTLLYSSTVPHYTNATQFNIGTTVANVSGNMYPTSNTLASGTAAGAFAAPASVNYNASNVGSNTLNSFQSASFTTTANVTTGFGASSTGPQLSVNNSYSTGTLTLTTALANIVLWKSGTATAVDEGNIVITSLGTGSGNAVRIVNPGTGNTPVYTANATAFNSQSSTLQTYDATVVGSSSQGVLKHDQTNYSTGYLPVGPDLSAGRSGTQYFTFKFVRTDVSKFDITYAGNVAGMWVALPGSVIDASSSANGWINMAAAYGGAGYPGVNSPGNGSDGCSLGGVVTLNVNTASVSKTCTFGTVSSSSTATNEIYVRIALTSGQTVTGLSLKAASN